MFGCGLEDFVNFIPPSFLAAFSVAKTFKFDQTMCHDYGVKLSNLIDVVERKLSKPISKFEEEYWRNACLGIGYARKSEDA